VLLDKKNFYKKSIKKHGVSPLGVHWQNQETQYARFDALTSFIKGDIVDSTIVDAGCGFGEYYKYLKEQSLLPKKYIGIDKEKEMIKRAKERFDTTFEIKDIVNDSLPIADYYVCSGALNILDYEEMELFINNMYRHSKKGMVVNYLKGFTFNGIYKEEVKQIMQGYSRNIMLKEDYLENDFTIFMVK
jgi:SAM-dependent methyltransferase